MKKLLFLVLFFLFTIDVNASSYSPSQFTAQLYDNINGSLSSVTTFSSDANHNGVIPLQAYSSGGAWGISSPTVMLANHTYTLTANVIPSDCGSLALSTYNRIGVGTTLSNAVTSYSNNTNVTENYSKVVGSDLIQFAFTPSINSSYLVFAFSTTSSCSSSQVFLTDISFDDLGTTGVTETEINNSLNNQTNELNSSIQNSTNTITDAITDVEDSINNTINDNFQSCPDPVELSYSTGKKFNTSGALIDDTNYSYTEDYYSFDSSHKITFKNVGSSNVGYVILYDSSKEQIGYFGIRDRTINSPSAVYYRLSTNNLNLQVYLGTGECTNKIDETNDKLDDLNNSITSEDSPDTSGLSDVAGWLPPGPVDSLINLPLSLFNSISRDLGSTCSPITLPLPYVNKDLTLPCMSTFYEGIGIGDFMDWIGVIASGFMLFSYLMKLYKWVDDTLTFRENNHLDNWGGV